MNEIKLSGKIGFKKESNYDKGIITSFSLSYSNGKNKEGKTEYAYKKVVFFGETPFLDKEDVKVFGYLKSRKYIDKEGKEQTIEEIIAKEIVKYEYEKPISGNKDNDKQTPTLEDEIPF